jgi:2,3-bisphosphoglycerate-independent phosphoglycerate mutase
MLNIILIFIDGFGIGNNNPVSNPMLNTKTPGFDYLKENFSLYSTDTCLGVSGLPQSATGQAALYTGINVPKIIGRHISARPTKNIINIIEKDNLFKKLLRMNLSVTFSNVYSHEYIDKMKTAGRGYFSPSVTSIMNLSANLPFRMIDDYNKGNGVYHDIRGTMLKKYYSSVELTGPKDAALNLYNLSRDYNFTLFEYFMTDLIGHKKNMKEAVLQIELLDTFLMGLINKIDFSKDMLILTSDHGNIEDISVKTHTTNPVPTIIATNRKDLPPISIKSLLDITPAICDIFKNNNSSNKQ